MRGGGGGAGGQWEAEGGGAAGGGDDVITIGRGGGERASVAMETAAPGSPPVPPPRPPPLPASLWERQRPRSSAPPTRSVAMATGHAHRVTSYMRVPPTTQPPGGEGALRPRPRGAKPRPRGAKPRPRVAMVTAPSSPPLFPVAMATGPAHCTAVAMVSGSAHIPISPAHCHRPLPHTAPWRQPLRCYGYRPLPPPLPWLQSLLPHLHKPRPLP